MNLIIFLEKDLEAKKNVIIGFSADIKSFNDFMSILEKFGIKNIFSEKSIHISKLNNVAQALKELEGGIWTYLEYGRTGIITEVSPEKIKLFLERQILTDS